MLDTRHIKDTQNQNKAKRQFGKFKEKDGEKEHRQPRRPETRAPSGPSALRAYSPARTAAAEAAPRASWAFSCAASDDEDVEANRRGALA